MSGDPIPGEVARVLCRANECCSLCEADAVGRWFNGALTGVDRVDGELVRYTAYGARCAGDANKSEVPTQDELEVLRRFHAHEAPLPHVHLWVAQQEEKAARDALVAAERRLKRAAEERVQASVRHAMHYGREP